MKRKLVSAVVIAVAALMMTLPTVIAPTSDFYIYSDWPQFDVFQQGQGVGCYEDLIYIDNYGTANVYRVTIPDGADPNMHPDNPDATGPIAPRTLTMLPELTHDIAADIGYSIVTSVSEFYVDDTGIYFGPMGWPSDSASASFGVIYHWDHDWNFLGAAVNGSKPGIYFQTLGYDSSTNTWFTGCVEGREVYSFTPGVDTAWQYEFSHTDYGGSHHDGLEFVSGSLWVSDMTVATLAQWELVGGVWTEVNVFNYPYFREVEGMGFGPLSHFWITSFGALYEVGGGELQQEIRELIAKGWGKMWAECRFVRGPAELYILGESAFELVITYKGEEYSRTWEIERHYFCSVFEVFDCYDDSGAFLKVTINHQLSCVQTYVSARFNGQLING